MSVNIMEMVKNAVSQQVMNKIGGMIGLDESKTSSALETAAGSILGGLIAKSSAPGGADQVFGAVQNQDAGILDNLGDLLGGGDATDQFQKQGGGVLDMVFGGQRGVAEKAVGSTLGLGEGVIGKLMSMAAPILMGVIGNYVKSKALNAVGLGSLLGEQKTHLAGLLPSSLTSNLGLGDMLDGAGNAAANVAGAATGAVNQASDAAYSAAGDAAEAGGGLLKKILPLGLLAAVLAGLWFFVISPLTDNAETLVESGKSQLEKVEAGAANMVDGMKVPGLDLDGMDLSVLGDTQAKLMEPIKGITDGFTGLAEGGEEAANGLVEKITGFGTSLEGMGISDMGEPQKAAVGGILGQFTGVLEGLIAKVPAPLQAIVKPAVDSLLQKIQSFGL